MNILCRIFGHKWQLVEPKPYERFGKCHYRCKRCQQGATMHKWQSVPGKCYDKCEVCGEMRYFMHDYKDGKCVRCGEPAPQPRQKLSYEESMANSDEGIGSGGVRGGW